ncbi:hypothetical protein SCHPADRAFT_589809 [Schizopora paradoxa]|uniref:Uncharacterized protein n=1 Tax=Schizopora paradoxa TaxID=27342 RepID=A0A0H2RAJ2_9AGAM|nr:hypothetical protein SCHPADRAFT_589809 [Schizopora paradoxa]
MAWLSIDLLSGNEPAMIASEICDDKCPFLGCTLYSVILQDHTFSVCVFHTSSRSMPLELDSTNIYFEMGNQTCNMFIFTPNFDNQVRLFGALTITTFLHPSVLILSINILSTPLILLIPSDLRKARRNRMVHSSKFEISHETSDTTRYWQYWNASMFEVEVPDTCL